MAVIEDLVVAYHQQDTSYYCGAACVQMVLDSIGTGLLDQDALYLDNNGHSTTEPGWYSGPDGVTWTLNARRLPGAPQYFVLNSLASEDAISRKIAWTIHHYHVAPIALIFGSQHWIVVRGYEADAAPASYSDTAYSITSFNINNPWPPVPAGQPGTAPPPHGTTDGCGAGGDRGVADEHLAYSTWQSDYMTGATGGHWAGKFVAVCDPDPPASGRGAKAGAVHIGRGTELIRPAEAAERALAALRETGLSSRAAWASALRESRPAEPVLVQRLDRLDSFYYIVPMSIGGQRTPVAVGIDAHTGQYRQAIALHGGDRSVFRPLRPESFVEAMLGRTVELPEPLGRVRLRPEALCLSPTLVWRPCRESLSAFYPFWMLTIGSHILYLRIDGQLFTTLHTGLRGI